VRQDDYVAALSFDLFDAWDLGWAAGGCAGVLVLLLLVAWPETYTVSNN
jgi:hypothetical protein